MSRAAAAGATRKNSLPARAASLAQRLGLWLRRILAGAFALAVVAVVILAGRQLQQMPIERVVVSGSLQQVSREQIQQMVMAGLEGGFLGVDLEGIRAPLEQLPWVHRVVVKRSWPNRLEIIVTEQLPIARWGEQAFVNHEGDVFIPGSVPHATELPLLQGPAGSQAVLMQHYMSMHNQLMPLQLEIAELAMNRRGGLRALLSDGTELVFGSDNIESKLQRYLVFHGQQLARHDGAVERVDLRYESGLAVVWRNGVAAR